MSKKDSVFITSDKVTEPWDKVYSVTKNVIIDSRQRNCVAYKTPSYYRLDLGDVYKNITSLELKGAIIPKSSYNVHSSNNKIDFAIGDFVSGFNIINGGSGYTSAPNVTITNPQVGGITATASAIINIRGEITQIIINQAGSGYSPSKPPYIFIDPPNNIKQSIQPRINVIVGNHYTAELRIGEYDIGGNPVPPSLSPTNILNEIQNSMNYAVNGGLYSSTSSNPFVVRLVSQYPELGATAGTPEAMDTNACKFNRIQITNVDSEHWELLFCSGPNSSSSSCGIMGFNTVDSEQGFATPGVTTDKGVLIPPGISIRAPFDYNLNNDPDYVILTISTGELNLDRIGSLDDGIDHRFCVLLFDNNNPETLHDISNGTSGFTTNVDGIDYLEGPCGKGTFWRPPGGPKPMKGYDFDLKKINFSPALGKLNSLSIAFTKFGLKSGGSPELYDMKGREHLLMFEIIAADQRTRQWE